MGVACWLAVAAWPWAAGGAPVTVGPVEKVAEGFQFTEGPLWLGEEGWVFSDIPADAIFRADKTVFRTPSGKSNGLTLDRKGRLISCEHWNRCVSRSEPDGTRTVLADRYEGKRFNSPNDIAVRSDGLVFFTDPTYGLENRDREIPFCGVYAIRPGRQVVLLSRVFAMPNGLAFSPDERTLYVGDSKEGLVRSFSVAADGALADGKVFCETPGPDGMKVDAEGRLWVCAQDGVRVYAPTGDQETTVVFPEQPANCAFGGGDSTVLFVTARHGAYKVRCAVEGLHPLRKAPDSPPEGAVDGSGP